MYGNRITIEEATAASVACQIGDQTVFVSALTLGDLGDLAQWVRQRWLYLCERGCADLAPGLATSLRAWAHEEAARISTGGEIHRAFLSSPEGELFLLWLHLRRKTYCTPADIEALERDDGASARLWDSVAVVSPPEQARSEANTDRPIDFAPLYRRFGEQFGWTPDMVNALTPRQIEIYLPAETMAGIDMPRTGRVVRMNNLAEALALVDAIKKQKGEDV